ncbi:MAG: GNAT family N-acetyltransferase [Candidatus Berkelbacteria bacterium]|nr:GNAT family N-acetyltransferase [Candidatus Berkelbacteria bacterium]
MPEQLPPTDPSIFSPSDSEQDLELVETGEQLTALRIERFTPLDNPQEYRDNDTSVVVFDKFVEFIGELREKYPDRNFPSLQVLFDNTCPAPLRERSCDNAAYFAYLDDNTIGAIFGMDHGDRKLGGQWFVVDPEFQNKRVARELMVAVSADYDTVWITAGAFGENQGRSIEETQSRQAALVRYYKSLGFTIEKVNQSLISEVKPVEMVYKRKQEN